MYRDTVNNSQARIQREGGVRKPPPWDLSEVDSCAEVCLVGEGVQMLCLSYYCHFFSCSLRSPVFYKHITGIHTSKFNVHYETVILFLDFPHPNHEKDPTSQPLLYFFKRHFLFCLELHDLKPFKPKIFWGRTPPPRHIYNIKTTTSSVCLCREAWNCTKDHFLPSINLYGKTF